MVKEIVRDQIFLAQALDEVKKDDDFKSIAEDLKDTLAANKRNCVGMTANMIGIKKRVIIVTVGIADMVLLNPRIIRKSGEYQTEEGCLSLDGVRKCTRYETITVAYYDLSYKRQMQTFSGFLAQNIQHQIDHCNGIVI
ncbi:MAG: peptide deformylase [Lachnospiraceae bacterium]|nr:peptide deformylase [Lachnospiraceae bacterium]